MKQRWHFYIVGAHYLSDVCIGGLLAVIFYYIANEIIIQKFLSKEESVKLYEK